MSKLDEMLSRYGYEVPESEGEETAGGDQDGPEGDRPVAASKGDGYAAARHYTHKAAEERWAKFLVLVAQGMTSTDACAEIGVTLSALWMRNARNPEFKARYDTIKHRLRSADRDVPWDGTTAGFAMKFIPPPEDSGLDWPDEPYSYSFFQHAVTEVLDSAREGDIVLVTIPPGGRKTTTLENWIIKAIATDPEIRIGYISKSGDHAVKSCARIRNVLHDDPTLAPDLIARFGPFKEHGQERKGKPWASQRFTVSNKTTSTRDYTFSAMGAGNQIYGARFDKIIIDDFQTNQNIDQTEKLLHQFRYEIMTRRPTGMTKDGRMRGVIVIIGTRVDAGDIYERLVDEFGGEEWFHYIDFPVLGSDGASLDPECFPDAIVPQLRKQVGPEVWAASYMQRPATAQSPTFSEGDVQKAKKPRLLLGWGELDEHGIAMPGSRPADWGVAIGLDPNLGAGYTSITAAGFSGTRFRILDNEERYGLSRTEDILDLLEEFLQRYDADDVRIEINNFQRGLARDDRLMGNPGKGIVGLRQTYGVNIREHTTSGASRDDDQIGISRMSKTFIAGDVDIPWGDDLAVKRMEPLCLELRAWRPKVTGAKLKQDRVQSLWFSWLVWQERRGRDLSRANPADNRWRTRGMGRAATPYVPALARR